jgi:hypothetical protein
MCQEALSQSSASAVGSEALAGPAVNEAQQHLLPRGQP